MLKSIFTSAFILICVISSSSVLAHKYYAGITTITLNPNTQSLEIVHQLFVDDIDRVLRQFNKASAPVISEENLTEAEKLVKQYLKQNFAIQSASGETLALSFVGMEFDVSNIWIYQEIQPFTQGLETLSIYNTLLVKEFDEQINTVVLGRLENKKTMIFDRRQPALQAVIP